MRTMAASNMINAVGIMPPIAPSVNEMSLRLVSSGSIGISDIFCADTNTIKFNNHKIMFSIKFQSDYVTIPQRFLHLSMN